MERLMREIREAVKEERFLEYKKNFLRNFLKEDV
jgi:queuine/archaeosine tRNA-ribosyltransferase